MNTRSKFLVVLLLLSTSLQAQETRATVRNTASARIVNYNTMSAEELVSFKAEQRQSVYSYRQLDKKLYSLGYVYPAVTNVSVEGNNRKFSFTEIVTSNDSLEIKSFVQKITDSKIKGLIAISISPKTHICEFTVDQNIDAESLQHIFSTLGFKGYVVYAQN